MTLASVTVWKLLKSGRYKYTLSLSLSLQMLLPPSKSSSSLVSVTLPPFSSLVSVTLSPFPLSCVCNPLPLPPLARRGSVTWRTSTRRQWCPVHSSTTRRQLSSFRSRVSKIGEQQLKSIHESQNPLCAVKDMFSEFENDNEFCRNKNYISHQLSVYAF